MDQFIRYLLMILIGGFSFIGFTGVILYILETVRDEKEFIDPLLVDIMNEIDKEIFNVKRKSNGESYDFGYIEGLARGRKIVLTKRLKINYGKKEKGEKKKWSINRHIN